MSRRLLLGILGYPLGHTVSPVLHQYLMQHMNIKGEYVAYETPPDKLEETVLYLKTLGVRGINVTIPHKVNVMGLVTAVDEMAQYAGAVNTLVFEHEEDGRVQTYGYNTDVVGFLRGVPPNRIGALEEARVLVLGAGGAARAVIMGLLQYKAKSVTLCARSESKAAVVMNAAKRAKRLMQSSTQLSWLPMSKLENLSPFDWIINATPIGMVPTTNAMPLTAAQVETINPGALVYDLIYRPVETRLLAACKARNIQTQNGLDMLLHQGVLSFECWTNRRVPASLLPGLRQALADALAQSAEMA